MRTFNQKNIGTLLVGFALILLFILVFVKSNIDSQSAFLCDAVHANPELEMSECPVHKSNTSWLLVGAFGIAFLILGSGIYMIFMPSTLQKEGKDGHGEQQRHLTENIDISKLDDDEKKIYSLVTQHEGSMYQSDLIKETGMSKVQITRVLDRLEGKKIIERKRRGMTNIVVIK